MKVRVKIAAKLLYTNLPNLRVVYLRTRNFRHVVQSLLIYKGWVAIYAIMMCSQINIPNLGINSNWVSHYLLVLYGFENVFLLDNLIRKFSYGFNQLIRFIFSHWEIFLRSFPANYLTKSSTEGFLIWIKQSLLKVSFLFLIGTLTPTYYLQMIAKKLGDETCNYYTKEYNHRCCRLTFKVFF